jgi:hypothetical protein
MVSLVEEGGAWKIEKVKNDRGNGLVNASIKPNENTYSSGDSFFRFMRHCYWYSGATFSCKLSETYSASEISTWQDDDRYS